MTLTVEVFGARAVARARAAVIVPACNEAERIGACLDALAAQDGLRDCAVTVCVNNTGDATAEIVRDSARRHRLALTLAEVQLPRGGVGRARRLGHLLAMRHSPMASALLSTDADCVAAPGWMSAMRHALRGNAAVLGRIEGLDDLPPPLMAAVCDAGRTEDSYMRLSLEFARLVSDPGATPLGLNTAGGANLGIRRDVYRAVGGFRALPSREDRELVDRIVAAGHRSIRSDEALVRASMRPDGRAPGGMADKIRDRLAGAAGPLDSALAPVGAMVSRCLGQGAATCDAFSSPQAERELTILARHVEALRRLDGPAARRRYLSSVDPALP
ncbi:glycosyltransferase [Citreimonas sp.]|uniref:glycosyltransferase n=1 Tax=Citreimonas sp. TaxID=3036715 RepID=UPI004057EE6F